MRQVLIKTFGNTISQVKAEVALMPLTRWNESVFRFKFSRAVTREAPGITQLLEHSKIDLVLHRESELAFVEFKFYIHSWAYDPLSGIKTKRMKSYPSPKNYREFKECVETLRGRAVPTPVLKLVALFYADPVDSTEKKKTYDFFYGGTSGVEDKLNIRRLDKVEPFRSSSSPGNCNARLYEVGP